jgi:hypothetical protein
VTPRTLAGTAAPVQAAGKPSIYEAKWLERAAPVAADPLLSDRPGEAAPFPSRG